MIETIGWLGGIFFALCALPQVFLCYRTGHAEGTSWGLLILWLLGELLMTVYVLAKHGWDLPLMVNYIANILFILIILKYKISPRK